MKKNEDLTTVVLTLDQYRTLHSMATIGAFESGSDITDLLKSVRRHNAVLKEEKKAEMRKQAEARQKARQEEKRQARMLSQWQPLVGSLLFANFKDKEVVPVELIEYHKKKQSFKVKNLVNETITFVAASHLYKSDELPSYMRISIPQSRMLSGIQIRRVRHSKAGHHKERCHRA